MGTMMTDGVIPSRHNEKWNKIKRAEGGRRTAGWKFSGSSSAVGSIKKTMEEAVEIDGSGSETDASGRETEVNWSVPLQADCWRIHSLNSLFVPNWIIQQSHHAVTSFFYNQDIFYQIRKTQLYKSLPSIQVSSTWHLGSSQWHNPI